MSAGAADCLPVADSPAQMPMRLFDAVDVAERALAVHGGPGCSLAVTRAKMAQLVAKRRTGDERRGQVKEDMAARRVPGRVGVPCCCAPACLFR